MTAPEWRAKLPFKTPSFDVPLAPERIVCKPSMIRSPSSTLGLDADFVIHRGLNSLFATKISFGCLH
jgi:hypothetical protein